MKVCVRRVNEWDAPGMLKIYGAAIDGRQSTYERETPALWEFVRRIDRYTYGKGWTVCDVDGWTAGFAVAHECFDCPDDPFMMDVEVYVDGALRRRGIGSAVLGLLRDIAEMGDKKALRARFPHSDDTLAFYKSCGFAEIRRDEGFRPGETWTVVERRLDARDVESPTKPFLVPQGEYERIRREWGATINGVTEVL